MEQLHTHIMATLLGKDLEEVRLHVLLKEKARENKGRLSGGDTGQWGGHRGLSGGSSVGKGAVREGRHRKLSGGWEETMEERGD